MSKKSGAKGKGGSTPVAATVALSGGVFLLRKVLGTVWKKTTGKEPPTDLTDPKVTLVEALAWALVTGLIVETARYAAVHAAMRRSSGTADSQETS